nr:hypothetical protein [Sphingopyxis sp. H115]
MKSSFCIGGHHHLDLFGVDLARSSIERGKDGSHEPRMRAIANVLRRRDQFDAGLLELPAVSLAFILVAKESTEIVDEYGVIAFRPRAGVGDHPLECRTAVGHAGLARLDIGFDDLVATLHGGAGDTPLLLVERGLVLGLTFGADPHIGAGAQGHRISRHRQVSSQGRRPTGPSATVTRQAEEGKSPRADRPPPRRV